MSPYEIINLLISSFALITASIAVYYTYKNLHEIQKQFFEQNRGNLVFYIEKRNTYLSSTIVKNFGNSPAKLIKLTMSPNLNWELSRESMPNSFLITNCTNVFLAPGQFIESIFDFHDYPDETFEININYQTCGKTITETYTIDLSYTHNVASSEPEIKDKIKGLKEINRSIRELSDRFL